MSRDSFLKKTLSGDHSGTLLLGKTGEGEDPVEKPMSHLVLTKAKIEVSHQRRERVDIFVKVYWGVTDYEPSEIAHHLEGRG